jgi:hypothetical protein
MSQKKINGYVIFLKDILGKGAYGSVSINLHRSIEDNKMVPSFSVRSRSFKKD